MVMTALGTARMGIGRARWLARMLFVAGWVLAMASFGADALAQTQTPVPVPAMASPVVDTTGTLDEATRAQLEGQARALRQRKGSQLQVLMIDSTGPEDIDAYALRAFEQFRLGREDVSDGVLVVVAKRDKRVRIEVGYGLEGAITDAQAAAIIRDYLSPRFGEGDYAGGLREATAALTGLIDGEALPAPSTAPPAAPAEPLDWVGWRRVDTSWSLAFVIALAVAAMARTRELPRAIVWPVALFLPLVFAWMWSEAGSIPGAVKFAVAGVAIGHWLPRQRWLRLGLAGFATAVAIAIAVIFFWQGRAPNLLGIFYGLVAQLFTVPVLSAVVAPPMAAWGESRVGFAIRMLLALPLGWYGWKSIPAAQQGLGMAPGVDASSVIVFGVFGLFVWVSLFLFEPRFKGWGRSRGKASPYGYHRSSKSRKKKKKKSRKSGSPGISAGASGSGSSSSSSSGGSGSSGGSDGWSGGGGRSGGGGASGSW